MRRLLSWGIIVLAGMPLLALSAEQEPGTTAAKTFQVQLRFRIDATPRQRPILFDALVKRLKDLGFAKDKGLEGEDFFGDQMTGRLPASAADKLSQEPAIEIVLLIPSDYELPASAEAPILVRLDLQKG